MIETRRLKNVVTFIQTILSFVLSTKIINDDEDGTQIDGSINPFMHNVEKCPSIF